MAAARVLYQPRRRASIAGQAVARFLPVRRRRSSPPPEILSLGEEVAARAGVEFGAAAVVHVRETDRWLFAILSSHTRGAFAKLGRCDDVGLAREASTLRAVAAADGSIRIPSLRWHGSLAGRSVIVTDIVQRRKGTADPGLDDAFAAACTLARMPGGFVVHGDLAPWNMVPTEDGVVLVDWEESRIQDDPLYDLAHYVTRVGALLRSWRPAAAVRHLMQPGSVGSRYLVELGLDPESAGDHLARYLGRREAPVQSLPIRRYEQAMMVELASRKG
jgi:hypothetical protein